MLDYGVLRRYYDGTTVPDENTVSEWPTYKCHVDDGHLSYSSVYFPNKYAVSMFWTIRLQAARTFAFAPDNCYSVKSSFTLSIFIRFSFPFLLFIHTHHRLSSAHIQTFSLQVSTALTYFPV